MHASILCFKFSLMGYIQELSPGAGEQPLQCFWEPQVLQCAPGLLNHDLVGWKLSYGYAILDSRRCTCRVSLPSLCHAAPQDARPRMAESLASSLGSRPLALPSSVPLCRRLQLRKD